MRHRSIHARRLRWRILCRASGRDIGNLLSYCQLKNAIHDGRNLIWFEPSKDGQVLSKQDGALFLSIKRGEGTRQKSRARGRHVAKNPRF